MNQQRLEHFSRLAQTSIKSFNAALHCAVIDHTSGQRNLQGDKQ